MLNDAQQQAVVTRGNLVITACPGSGKTTVLVHRAQRILESDPRAHLVGVTFSAKAAAELDSRIRAKMPGAGRRLTCGTFHSLCKRQLEARGKKLNLITGLRQLDLARHAYKDVAAGLPEGPSFDEALAYIEATKATVDPIHAPSDALKTEVYHRYQELLSQMGANDFADLLLLAVQGMQDGSIKPYPVQYMLVDEFQDTDAVQLQWVKAHLLSGVEVSVVGDDDQSIFGWRSAAGYAGIEDFRLHAKAQLITLDTTYRCAQQIMVPAARLIAHNLERIPKSLRTKNTRGGVAAVRRYGSREDEFDAILEAVASSPNPADWAVLARTNAQLEALEGHMSQAVPVVRSGGTSFWDLRGPALFLSLCRSLALGEMVGIDEALRRSGVGEEEIERIHVQCRSKEAGAARRFAFAEARPRTSHPVGRLQDYLQRWMRTSTARDADLTPTLLGIAHYIKSHVTLYKRRSELDREMDNRRLDRCVDSLKRIPGTLVQRLNLISQTQESAQDNAARLMTLHASKGLEFENVWILGAEEGNIPSSGGDRSEERRLAYVGMTRAKSLLILSYVVSTDAAPSSFLAEAGLA